MTVGKGLGAVDELTLMWQSAPARRSEEPAGPESWFGQMPDRPAGSGSDAQVVPPALRSRSVHEEGFTVSWSANPGDGRPAGGWVFRRPDSVLAPFGGMDIHVREDASETDEAPNAGGSPDRHDPMDPDRIRPGWRGERFSLADSVGVLCRAGGQVQA